MSIEFKRKGNLIIAVGIGWSYKQAGDTSRFSFNSKVSPMRNVHTLVKDLIKLSNTKNSDN